MKDGGTSLKISMPTKKPLSFSPDDRPPHQQLEHDITQKEDTAHYEQYHRNHQQSPEGIANYHRNPKPLVVSMEVRHNSLVSDLHKTLFDAVGYVFSFST
jgi:hypothetical protein